MIVPVILLLALLLSVFYQFNVNGRVGRFLFRWDHFRLISGYRFFESVDVHYRVSYRVFRDGCWSDWLRLDTCCRADSRWPGLLHEICNLIYLERESGLAKASKSMAEEALLRYFRSYPGSSWEAREFQIFVMSKGAESLLKQGRIGHES